MSDNLIPNEGMAVFGEEGWPRIDRLLLACGFTPVDRIIAIIPPAGGDMAAASAAHWMAEIVDPMRRALESGPRRICAGGQLLDAEGNVVYDFDEDPLFAPADFPEFRTIRLDSRGGEIPGVVDLAAQIEEMGKALRVIDLRPEPDYQRHDPTKNVRRRRRR